MKKIAKQLALFVLVMFGLQASARTCAFMQVGGELRRPPCRRLFQLLRLLALHRLNPLFLSEIAISSLALCPPQPNPLLSIPLKKRQVLLVAEGI